MILDVVQKSYQSQVMQNELVKQTHDSVMVGGNNPEAMLELFHKMRTHCDFLTDLDSLSDMNNAEKLRDVIQNEAYILAITAQKNKVLTDELKKQQKAMNLLRIEQSKIEK